MIRRPPRSTLFPYTTSSDLALLRRPGHRNPRRDHRELAARRDLLLHAEGADRRGRRSEEHTSELQSQSNLVCRLLLEKKKKKYQTTQINHNYPPTLSPYHSL